jgi:hypothetical protein
VLRATRAGDEPGNALSPRRTPPGRITPRNGGRGRTPATPHAGGARFLGVYHAQRGPGPNPGNASPPSTTRTAWPACWTGCGRQARTSRLPRRQLDCRRPACSSSSSSRKTPRISSVSDGRPTAPRPRYGAGKTWTYGLFPVCRPASCLSFCLIHPRPGPFTSDRPSHVRAGHGRRRTLVNAGAHCWKACCCLDPTPAGDGTLRWAASAACMAIVGALATGLYDRHESLSRRQCLGGWRHARIGAVMWP